MNDVTVFSFGRTASARCHNKMLRPFAGTTLTDIVLQKLARLGLPCFFSGYEDEFKSKCATHGVPFIPRSQRSATIDGPITEILGFLEPIPSRYFIIVSACLPLLSVDDIRRFAETSMADRRPAMSARTHHTYFLRARDRAPLSFDGSGKTINTKTVEPVIELVHALYFFEKKFFFDEGRYWDWDQVRFHEMARPHRLVDIDTEEDFAAAQELWSATEPTKVFGGP